MHKRATLSGLKAGPGDGLAEGQFTAYASVFDVKDSYGDVVRPGAFTETLAAWAAAKDDAYVARVQGLPAAAKAAGTAWLQKIVDGAGSPA